MYRTTSAHTIVYKHCQVRILSKPMRIFNLMAKRVVGHPEWLSSKTTSRLLVSAMFKSSRGKRVNISLIAQKCRIIAKSTRKTSTILPNTKKILAIFILYEEDCGRALRSHSSKSFCRDLLAFPWCCIVFDLVL